jgi:AraC-like DNA-binding protein
MTENKGDTYVPDGPRGVKGDGGRRRRDYPPAVTSLRRPPARALRPFVREIWASREEHGAPGRERMLPTGATHLVFRLSEPPVRLFAGVDDPDGVALGHALVGGARSTFYVRDVVASTASVGAILHPGAAELLFGASASALAGRHTRLDDLWGRAAGEARERLVEAATPARQLELLEQLLAARLPTARAVHPAVAHALGRFAVTDRVGEVVAETGYSHRRFIALFERAVGLTPKVHCRVLRFQRALAAARDGRAWSEVALAAGYSDQSHLVREFGELAGITPTRYAALAGAASNHVAIR